MVSKAIPILFCVLWIKSQFLPSPSSLYMLKLNWIKSSKCSQPTNAFLNWDSPKNIFCGHSPFLFSNFFDWPTPQNTSPPSHIITDWSLRWESTQCQLCNLGVNWVDRRKLQRNSSAGTMDYISVVYFGHKWYNYWEEKWNF